MTSLANVLRALVVAAVAVTSAYAANPGDVDSTKSDAKDAAPATKDVLSGTWGGTYQCLQGQTAVVVTLALEDGGTVSGTFAFGNLPGQTNAREGKYRIVGIFDAATGGLHMQPNGWIDQPKGYLPVGFTAELDSGAQRLTGQIGFAGCSRISLDRLGK